MGGGQVNEGRDLRWAGLGVSRSNAEKDPGLQYTEH